MIVNISRYRRGKKQYATGGWNMSGGENWQNAGNIAGSAGNLGVDLWDKMNPPDEFGYDSNLKGKSALKGAASGAAIGTQILPGWGTAIGAVAGGVGGLISGGKQQADALEAKNLAIGKRSEYLAMLGNQRTQNYDFTGTKEEKSVYATGGQLKPLNSDTVEVEGKSHAEGGVQLSNAEVEDNETITKDYVFSDLLGFAKPHKRIAQQIGKIEAKPTNNERKTSLEILRKKEEALKQQQEQIREELGVNLYDNINKQLGGEVTSSWNKYKTGGPIEPKVYNPTQATNDLLFQNWYKENTLEGQSGTPYSDNQSYDYYSFFKNKGVGNIKDHFPDTYKRPSHPTFSNESLYSTPEKPGGKWKGEKYKRSGKFKYS